MTVTGYDFLDTATYTCDEGYVVSGDAVQTCQSNFFWSGVAPTCIRECVKYVRSHVGGCG